ncbi:hypothetical protein [Nonomuraea pusilla]|uniref:Secreted protein n=1 Tax=Nonomuraea pusilla TaxID=46177 RepID=A0A1H8J058_9ACTN|nr:hypothetical protein [Nonomuraea pusilla]SEN73676.1 hypothetical protein SAMN05660976_08204 [Nonomuraea pusilla]
MHRSTRRLLSLSTACAAVIAGMTGVAVPASGAAVTAFDPPESWGPLYSRPFDLSGNRAMARGRYVLDEEFGDELTVTAKLYDRNSPTHLCAYLELAYEYDDEDEKIFSRRKCDPDGYQGFRRVDSSPDIPTSVSARVCYWDVKAGSKRFCGKWTYIYGDDEEE